MLTDTSIINAALEKRLYHLIISRLDGEKIPIPHYQDRIFQLVRNGLGGFIIFGGRKDEVKNFVHTLQTISEIPLFIASDIERGVGQQIQGSTLFPCQMAMAAAIDRDNPYDVAILEKAIHSVADEAINVGINMPLIPVLDVNQDPDNPIICTRAFSDDPEVVAWFGLKYITILEKADLLSCAKHFPGHGDTSIDSHISLPVINKSYEELISTDIIPFRAVIDQGISSIMIGHLSIPAIDTKPASLSTEIHSMLRSTLGFDGLILTDALTMHALNDIPDVEVRCLNAGVDILLHPAKPDEVVNTLLAAILSGRLHEDRIDNALIRVLKSKEKLRNIGMHDVDYQAHAKLSEQITDKSVTLVKGMPGIASVDDGQNIHIFMAGDEEPSQSSPLKGLSTNVWMLHDIGATPDLRNSIAIIAIFTSVAAWKGSSGISEDDKNRICNLIRRTRTSIVISFGNPYVLRHFPESDALIAAYEATDQAQETVVKWLKGSCRLEGRLPVRLS
ncbi:MAG: glycoside hydrolase family 3 protein [Nitrospirae bacterium]|nr:glycoside hydrolase family 3 protein [Nitrospirota bacterium]